MPNELEDWYRTTKYLFVLHPNEFQFIRNRQLKDEVSSCTLGNQGLRRQTSRDYGIVMRVTEPVTTATVSRSHRTYDRVSWEFVTRNSFRPCYEGCEMSESSTKVWFPQQSLHRRVSVRALWGVLRHESWCITVDATVYYAYQIVLDPGKLTAGDALILSRTRCDLDRLSQKTVPLNRATAPPLWFALPGAGRLAKPFRFLHR
jgi:hypothetical protein